MPHQRRASALGCRGRSPLAHQNQAGTDGRLPRTSPSEPPAIPENDAAITSPVSSGRPSIAPVQKKTRATGVDGTSQRLASSGNCGPRPRLKVRASPGAEAGDLRRRSDRDTRPRPPPGGLGGPRRPETRSRIPEQAAAGRARSPDAETDKAGSFSDQAGHFGSSWPGGGERPPIRYEDSWGGLRGPSDTQLLIYSYIKR